MGQHQADIPAEILTKQLQVSEVSKGLVIDIQGADGLTRPSGQASRYIR
jgi:hypothetical protein